MADFDAIHLRRGVAGPTALTEALDKLGVGSMEDFIVARASDVDEAFNYDENIVGPTGSSHPKTSRDAALLNYPSSGSQREDALVSVAQGALNGKEGRNGDEVEIDLDLPAQSATPRLYELRKGGWIQRNGKKRRTQRGGEGAVYEPTPKAWDALADERGLTPPKPRLFK